MIPVLYTLVFALVSINLLLGLPQFVKLASLNVPNYQKLASADNLPSQVPQPASLGKKAPVISATAALVKDVNSGELLYVKNPDKNVPIASTTKIMTALVALEYFKPEDVLTVVDSSIEGSSMGLKMGEQLSLRSLLYGLMLNSGNDAAFTIAANYPGGLPAFVKAMNNKGQEIGLLNTHFDNPAGFDSPNHYSSASDMAKIAQVAMDNTQLAWVVSTKEATVASADKNIIHPLKNLNKLLDQPGVLGVKTGTTPEARENLVGLIERGDRKLLTVILGSNDRFGETQALINWVEENFTFQK